jgi:hypothetical protein
MKSILAPVTKAIILSIMFVGFVYAEPQGLTKEQIQQMQKMMNQPQTAQTGMSAEQMQQLMKQGESARACMKKIDKTKLKALREKGKKVQAEIKALCDAGKRDKAQSTAIEYSMEMKKDPAFIEMTKCGEQMQGMMPKTYSDASGGHVCDSN